MEQSKGDSFTSLPDCIKQLDELAGVEAENPYYAHHIINAIVEHRLHELSSKVLSCVPLPVENEEKILKSEFAKEYRKVTNEIATRVSPAGDKLNKPLITDNNLLTYVFENYINKV